MSTVPFTDGMVCSNDADSPTQLVAISRCSPHRLSKHSWIDLGEVSSTDISDLGMNDVPRKIFTGIEGRLVIEFSTTAKQSRRVVILNSTSSLPMNSVPTAQIFLPSEVRCIIGIFNYRLLFLDKSAWVCSFNLFDKPKLASQGVRAAAKVDTGEEKQITRHFFIPDDWLSTDSEIMFQLLPNLNLFFVKGHEVAIISKAL
ncbi:hypothetical protein F5884DRAFT_854109 [Xylogone sp. PMI_703]|nr:hypothetical protein F5884DRAFT_854109 [Xylogone sp. PMI_703]